LIGSVCNGSGAHNEDHWGYAGSTEDVSVAWVLDGVTGINETKLFDASSDARWLVLKASARLQSLAADEVPLKTLLAELVHGLCDDVREALGGEGFPPGHDPPAACLMLVKLYGDGWQMLQLGDSSLLWRRRGDGGLGSVVPDKTTDYTLANLAAQARRDGITDIKALLASFRARFHGERQKRNQPGGYSILEANPAAVTLAQVSAMGTPAQILLCTDGYYRAVDHYGLHDDAGLLDASCRPEGAVQVLAAIRAAEALDPQCERFPRFKPADDATAVVLG
jgi:hypothetical protein